MVGNKRGVVDWTKAPDPTMRHNGAPTMVLHMKEDREWREREAKGERGEEEGIRVRNAILYTDWGSYPCPRYPAHLPNLFTSVYPSVPPLSPFWAIFAVTPAASLKDQSIVGGRGQIYRETYKSTASGKEKRHIYVKGSILRVKIEARLPYEDTGTRSLSSHDRSLSFPHLLSFSTALSLSVLPLHCAANSRSTFLIGKTCALRVTKRGNGRRE